MEVKGIEPEKPPVAALTGQGVPGQGDLSSAIGQVLYSLALEAAGNNCDCGPCRKARKLASLLAKQLETMGGTMGGRI